MLYYGILLAAVTMFSFQFLFNGIFEKEYGNGLRAMFVFSAGSSLVGFLILLIINGFKFEFTWFSLLMAFFAALDSIGYTYFSLKALGRINLSLYSMFSMLGGMILPSVVGILFYNEELTVGKGICYALLMLSLLLSSKKGEKKSGYFYYMGVFVLNGMSGVLSTIFQNAPYEKTSAAGYSMLISLLALVICLLFLPFVKGSTEKLTKKALVSMGGYGVLCRVGNYLLLIALAHLPASAQYPFVTGGVMIISTIISLFTKNKPSKREITGVAISFAALIILMFV
ncbi:MAG: EamA family transporter [Clostridia bacterium]|nr:EamA family transporter [Clostridia bacterium]